MCIIYSYRLEILIQRLHALDAERDPFSFS